MKKVLTILILALSISSFAQNKHPKVVSENVTKKNKLNQRTHRNSDVVEFKFADGNSGILVKRGDTWYNYDIRGESKEKPFDSKEAGLQEIWKNSVSAHELGAAAAGAVLKGKGGKSQKGILRDKYGAYKTVNGKKVYVDQ